MADQSWIAGWGVASDQDEERGRYVVEIILARPIVSRDGDELDLFAESIALGLDDYRLDALRVRVREVPNG